MIMIEIGMMGSLYGEVDGWVVCGSTIMIISTDGNGYCTIVFEKKSQNPQLIWYSNLYHCFRERNGCFQKIGLPPNGW